MPNLIIPTIIRSLHNIFTSIWIGGMLMMVISILPVVRKEIKDPAIRGSVMDSIMKRHSKWIYIGIIILAITGLLMTRFAGKSGGLFDFSNPYAVALSIKHILMILVSAIAVVRSIVFKHTASGKEKSKKMLSTILLFINTFLGVFILILSSLTVVLK